MSEKDVIYYFSYNEAIKIYFMSILKNIFKISKISNIAVWIMYEKFHTYMLFSQVFLIVIKMFYSY